MWDKTAKMGASGAAGDRNSISSFSKVAPSGAKSPRVDLNGAMWPVAYFFVDFTNRFAYKDCMPVGANVLRRMRMAKKSAKSSKKAKPGAKKPAK